MSAKKLPKGLPELPPVPRGYSEWEYLGFGVVKVGVFYGASFDPTIENKWEIGTWDGGNPDAHYLRAVKKRASKPAAKPPYAPAGKIGAPHFAVVTGTANEAKPAPKIPAHVLRNAAELAAMGDEAKKAAQKARAPVKAFVGYVPCPTITTRRPGVYLSGSASASKTVPVFVLPADAESVEAMVRQVYDQIISLGHNAHVTEATAKAVLGALGIKAKGAK